MSGIAASEQNWIGTFWNWALNGTIRIPALILSATSVAMAGEAIVRGIEALPIAPALKYNTGVGTLTGRVMQIMKPITDSYVLKHVSLRPFGERDQTGGYKIPHTTIVVSSIFGLALSGALYEIIRRGIGDAPPIYNQALCWVTPLRIHNGSLGLTDFLVGKLARN